MLSTVYEEDALKNEKAHCSRNSMFNAIVESVGKPEMGTEITHYTSKCQLATSNMEKGESEVKFARERAALDA